ncbi:MAG: hypothetical protein ACI83H_001276 [Glaciecola sp.]|jgi:hypothetical protein
MRNKLLVYVLLLVVAFNAYGEVNEDILNDFKEKLLEAKMIQQDYGLQLN